MRTEITYWNGERLDRFVNNETMIEHLHRYAIASNLAENKKLLDIACGEGYGSNILAKTAKQVIGIDIVEQVILNAKMKYKNENIIFKVGSIQSIPEEENTFDLITCFETLEHISEHEKAIKELKRVLTESGILLISTPDKLNYSDKTGYNNPHHKKELYEKDFKQLLLASFKHVSFYKQLSLSGSLILNEEQSGSMAIYTGDFESVQSSLSIEPMYWIAIASDSEIPIMKQSIFDIQKPISQIQEEQSSALKKTITYRLGDILLTPFKIIRSFFKK